MACESTHERAPLDAPLPINDATPSRDAQSFLSDVAVLSDSALCVPRPIGNVLTPEQAECIGLVGTCLTCHRQGDDSIVLHPPTPMHPVDEGPARQSLERCVWCE